MYEEDPFECYIDDQGYVEINSICESVNKSIPYFLDRDEIKEYILTLCRELDMDFDNLFYYHETISSFIFVHPKLALKVCEMTSKEYKKYLEDRIEEWSSSKFH